MLHCYMVLRSECLIFSTLLLQAIVKASGQHKQKIVINITLEGIKLIDLMTAVRIT